jgi:hypothetical protein
LKEHEILVEREVVHDRGNPVRWATQLRAWFGVVVASYSSLIAMSPKSIRVWRRNVNGDDRDVVRGNTILEVQDVT